jgi:excisionase family DNA binding protein
LEEFKTNNKTDLQKTKIEIIPQISILKEKDFLSISETAEYLGISKRTIERAIAEKTIEVVRIKRRVIIPKKSIQKLINL